VGLTPVQSEWRQTKIDNELFTGTAYHRVYRCPVGSLEADLATLTLGKVLPVAEGGVSTSYVGDPRLIFPVKCREKGEGGQVTIDATYVKIDVTGTAGTYNETTKSRRATTHDDGESMTIIAIATTLTDASIPARGYTEAGALPAAATDWCCASAQKTPAWEGGRVLVIAEFVKSRLQSAT